MLELIAWLSLAVAFLCALVIVADELGHPQKMWIMNIVWPVTALYLSIFAVWAYFRYGRKHTKAASQQMTEEQHKKMMEEARKNPRWNQVAESTSHCGAGCALGDILAEFIVFAAALSLFGAVLWADYVFDLIAAWLLGIVFQYFTIKPMRNLSPRQGFVAAIKADTLSILAFQTGMYTWMAIVFFILFPHPHLHPIEPQYWLMMQIAMIAGFLTSYPMNRWLVKRGWKEIMP